jgi:tetratricopeptide (TPR) repeat protein
MIRECSRFSSVARSWLAGSLVAALLCGCASTAQITGEKTGKEAQAAEKPAAEPVPRVPTSVDVMYNVFAAELLGSEGDLQGAVGLYLEAALESSDPEIARRATRIAFAARAWQQAAMAADRWALLDPDSVPAHENAAAAMLLTGDYASAELQVEQIIELMGDSIEAWIKVSTLLAQSVNPEKASALLENVLARHGNVNNANAKYAQSQLAVRERDLEKAYRLAEQAVELEPERVDFLTWAGRLAVNLDQKEAGLDYIERAWQQNPEDHDLALAYADLLARNGQADEARQVMEGMQQSPDVMLSRILFEISGNNMEAAEGLFREFSGMNFEDPMEKAFYRAQAAEALGKDQQAIEIYGLVKTGDNALASRIRRVELLAQQGEIAAARQELADMRLQTGEIFMEASWLAEARILRETGDGKTALEVLDVALEQLPASIPIRYSHALLAAELGWVDIAEHDLRIIISEEPENSAALNALGYTLADQTERFEEAEALIRQAYILEPEQAAIVDSMGWIAYRRGRLAESEEFLRRAWALERNPEIGAHLGEVLWVSGKHEAARAIWREAIKVDSENPVLQETLQRLGGGP